MIKTTVKGSFSVQVIRNGEVIKELPRQGNLILSAKMAVLSSFGNYVHVGTGSVAPTYSDTSLGNFLASAFASWNTGTPVLNVNVYEKEASAVFTFALGAVVGNLSELGVASAGGSGLQTRALFKDVLGDPTTVTVTALDQLVITYFVTKNTSMTTTTSSVMLDGNPIDYTIRPCISAGGDGGSSAIYPSSIYQPAAGVNFYLTVNDANRISVNPTTFVPTSIDANGDLSPEGSSVVTLTGTGNTILHTMTLPIESGNFQWVAATVSTIASASFTTVLFQIEFNGPNYIVKNNTETVTFKIEETVDQVV